MVTHSDISNKNDIDNEIEYEMKFEEEKGVGYLIRVIEHASTYSHLITPSLRSQIKEELKLEFNNEKALFDVLEANYNSRAPISFSCSFCQFYYS